MTWIVAPLMLAQVALVGWLVVSRPSPRVCLAAVMVAVAWIATFTLAVPAHDKLQAGGLDGVVVGRLVTTNWIRTVAWTLAFLLSLPGS